MRRGHAGKADLALLDEWKLYGTYPAFGGAVVQNAALFGRLVPEGTYFWDGVFGTSFEVDFANDLACVYMTQTKNAFSTPDYEDNWKRIQAIIHAAIIDD
jgi:CubicO group peptidase (beta-lactamase class C family)